MATSEEYNSGMSGEQNSSGWNILPHDRVPKKSRLKHVRDCSYFASGVLDRFPAWAADLNDKQSPQVTDLASATKETKEKITAS